MGRIIRWAWDRIGDISTVQWLWTIFGAAITGSLTWLAAQPLWLVAFVSLATVAIILIIISRYTIIAQSRGKSIEPKTAGRIVMHCEQAFVVPTPNPEGYYWILFLFPISPENGGHGMGRMYLKPIEQPTAHWGYHQWELVNYVETPLLKIKIRFDLLFRAAVRNETSISQGKITLSRSWDIEIPRIDVGETSKVIFYMQNNSEEFVWIRAPDMVSAQRADNGLQTQIPVSITSANPTLVGPRSLFEMLKTDTG